MAFTLLWLPRLEEGREKNKTKPAWAREAVFGSLLSVILCLEQCGESHSQPNSVRPTHGAAV